MSQAGGRESLSPGRVAVVTGSAGGIGLAVARACGGRGMRVAISDVNPQALEKARAGLVSEFSEERVLAVPCDVSSEADMRRLQETVYAHWGEVGFLHLNAGVGGGGASVASTSQQDWEHNIGVNLYGVANGLRIFLPRMQAQGTACAIAATASWAGLFNAATFSGVPYVVSKAGAVLMMEALHFELRRTKGCCVSAHVLCPGRVDTRMLAGVAGMTGASRLRNISDPDERARREAAAKKAVREATAGSMPPAEMASVLLQAVEANQFYVLGYDEQQPLAWLKMLARLRTEDIIHERPPLSHRAKEGSEQRRLLKEAMERGRAGSRL